MSRHRRRRFARGRRARARFDAFLCRLDRGTFSASKAWAEPVSVENMVRAVREMMDRSVRESPQLQAIEQFNRAMIAYIPKSFPDISALSKEFEFRIDRMAMLSRLYGGVRFGVIVIPGEPTERGSMSTAGAGICQEPKASP